MKDESRLLPGRDVHVRDRDSRKLGYHMDNIRIIDKEVSQAAPKCQDEACCHALEDQAQPDADHCCMQFQPVNEHVYATQHVGTMDSFRCQCRR